MVRVTRNISTGSSSQSQEAESQTIALDVIPGPVDVIPGPPSGGDSQLVGGSCVPCPRPSSTCGWWEMYPWIPNASTTGHADA